MNISAKPRARSRRIRAADWSGVGLVAAACTPVAAIAAAQPFEIRVAYLDPGTGSLILQAVIAAIAGTAVAIASYWQKIRAFFRRNFRDSEPTDNAPIED